MNTFKGLIFAGIKFRSAAPQLKNVELGRVKKACFGKTTWANLSWAIRPQGVFYDFRYLIIHISKTWTS